MHKIFMTEPEASIIKGADAIIEELGGFPSMENGRLVSISIKDCGLEGWRCARDITLVFDIYNWARDSSRYVNISKPKHRFIKMRFSPLRDFYINTPSMDYCGEFKFGNTADRDKMRQDMGTGLNPPIVERPFCCFYMRSAYDGLILEFDEDTCEISAEFIDDFMQ